MRSISRSSHFLRLEIDCVISSSNSRIPHAPHSISMRFS